MIKRFPNFRQLDAMDCGPTCLRMIAKYYGRDFSIRYLREKCFITRVGVSMLGISDAAESIGFRSSGVKISIDQLIEERPFPCILHWNQNHFVVCYGVRKRRGKEQFLISDPAGEKFAMDRKGFLKCWASTKVSDQEVGTALLLHPTPDFYNSDEKEEEKHGFGYLFRYLKPYTSQIIQLALGMGVGSLLALLLPFLTQAVVDQGIQNNNLSLITLILIAQLVVFVTQLGVEFIRNWILLHVNTRISISLISDFLAKLMRLPVSFFDSKNVGDILQRIGDNERIKSFLTGTTLSTVFSFFNFVVFGFILAYYNLTILGVFLIGNILYVCWILLFMKYRRKLDHSRFTQAASEQSNLVQMITGMQDIKLNNCEKQQRWKWERIQVKIFKISMKGLALGQYQQMGSVFFSQTTSLLLSFLAAKSVVEGQMTLGMMLSVSYIIGQLSGPISQVITFIQGAQDARISLERLGEIHNREDEEQTIDQKYNKIPDNHTFHIEDLWFSYSGSERDYVLFGLNVTIPENKVTAIVGASGSGKTTLVKLLQGIYAPGKGYVKVDTISLQDINPHLWRQHTGVVMQEGFIFSDTIAQNIAIGEEDIDLVRLVHAAEVANIREFIESLPLKYDTKIGMEGNGVSLGQRQRILIARAVYKNPDFIFFDEATNALDANNERVILDNLDRFYHGKTVVIVAHRLSTVQNADQILVMDHGLIVESGTHRELVDKRGAYYTLVKNQLELGS